ncbi:hypothetical protein [Roseivivax lentus]|uniref:hypothetical protein n=1 Tax=Roseivivax lentus TaxID=633194 RepID=UPI0013563318|nr:hypothetical protein [Roseivivax lentus]
MGIFAAMIEAPEGTPVATATVTGGAAGDLTYLTVSSVGDLDAACVRIWAEGPCHAVTRTRGLPGYDMLILLDAQVSSDDMLARAGALQMTRMPLVSQYDPASGDALSFMTQNDLGGWEMPVAPVAPSGQSAGLAILRDPAITALTAGAPVAHPVNGLVGIVARAGNGAGAVLPIGDAFRAAVAAGVEINEALVPQVAEEGGLPPPVAREIGKIYYFHDYSDLGYMGGFYGPGQAGGFDPSFVTTIDFSVWSVALSGAGGTKMAQGDKSLPLVQNGMALEAPFRGNADDHLASCIVHATPSSEGQPVLLVQFWRSVPERYNPNTDSKSYDEAAPSMTGWAAGESACEDAIRNMGPARLAALTNSETPTASAAQPRPDDGASPSPAPPPPSSVQDDWRRAANWTATGLEALFRDLPGGRILTVGCTASRELAIAISPGQQVRSIDGKTPSTGPDETSYILRSGDVLSSIRVQIGDDTLDVDVSTDVGPCE